MSDAENVLAALDELRDMGVRVALDDFGTGYSSLVYLRRLSVEELKIDQSFVRDMAKNGTSLAIIKAVRALAKELNIDMLVEGVETQEQLEILRANGADEAQGYLFSKPRPANEIARLVSDPAQLPRARKLNNPQDAAWTAPFERVNPTWRFGRSRPIEDMEQAQAPSAVSKVEGGALSCSHECKPEHANICGRRLSAGASAAIDFLIWTPACQRL